MKLKPFKWKTIRVEVKKVKPTPNNFKLKTEDGTARFKHSIAKFGRAGTIILNKDLSIIDGNTRWEDAKENGDKYIDASVPDRQLTRREYEEFSAMYDLARAGEVDVLRIKKELGTTKNFFTEWGLDMPKENLEALAEMEKSEGKVIATAKSLKKDKVSEHDTKMLTLVTTVKQYNLIMEKAEKVYGKYKVDNITDLVVKIFTSGKI